MSDQGHAPARPAIVAGDMVRWRRYWRLVARVPNPRTYEFREDGVLCVGDTAAIEEVRRADGTIWRKEEAR